MSNSALQIANLLSDNNKSASDMTHALKNLGDGDMQRGFSRIGNYFKTEISAASSRSLSKGRVEGLIVGIALSSLVVGGGTYYFHKKQKACTTHEAEGKQILETLQTSTTSKAGSSENNTKSAISEASEEISKGNPLYSNDN